MLLKHYKDHPHSRFIALLSVHGLLRFHNVLVRFRRVNSATRFLSCIEPNSQCRRNEAGYRCEPAQRERLVQQSARRGRSPVLSKMLLDFKAERLCLQSLFPARESDLHLQREQRWACKHKSTRRSSMRLTMMISRLKTWSSDVTRRESLSFQQTLIPRRHQSPRSPPWPSSKPENSDYPPPEAARHLSSTPTRCAIPT